MIGKKYQATLTIPSLKKNNHQVSGLARRPSLLMSTDRSGYIYGQKTARSRAHRCGAGMFLWGSVFLFTFPKSVWGSHLSITFTGRSHIALSCRSSARSRMDFSGKEKHGADVQSTCLQGHRGWLFGAAAWFGPKHLVAQRKREKGE